MLLASFGCKVISPQTCTKTPICTFPHFFQLYSAICSPSPKNHAKIPQPFDPEVNSVALTIFGSMVEQSIMERSRFKQKNNPPICLSRFSLFWPIASDIFVFIAHRSLIKPPPQCGLTTSRAYLSFERLIQEISCQNLSKSSKNMKLTSKNHVFEGLDDGPHPQILIAIDQAPKVWVQTKIVTLV